jgi:hypothetical protein
MMHEKRHTIALDTTMTAIACPTDIPCVRKVFGVCHVATFSAPLEHHVSTKVPLSLKMGSSLQTTCTEEVEPAPRSATGRERNQIAIAPRSCLLIVGLVCLQDGRLADSTDTFETHGGVSD